MQDFSIGDKVRVHMGNSVAREGEIIFKGETFFTVKFKNYPEAFQYFELRTGNVRMEILK
jgi:hypothetical protein